MKKVAIIVFANLLILEMVSFIFVISARKIQPKLSFDLVIDSHFENVSNENISAARRESHPIFGWDNNNEPRLFHNTAGDIAIASFGPDGARFDGRVEKISTINAYGDSFTLGDEVNDDQTWLYYVQEAIGAEVKNFGVGGYGVDQAWLKMKSHFDEGLAAKVTILCVYTDDLDRAVNRWRRFLNLHTRFVLGFKPSYAVVNDEVRLVPNPLQDPSVSRKTLKALAHELAETDYWAKRRIDLRFSFPFIRQVTSAVVPAIHEIQQRYFEFSLWSTEEGHKIMSYILNEFRAAAHANNTIPIVMLIPNVRRWGNGRRLPLYQEYKNTVMREEFPDILVIDVWDVDFDVTKFNILPFSGHASEYGNRVIAGHVVSSLRQHKILH